MRVQVFRYSRLLSLSFLTFLGACDSPSPAAPSPPPEFAACPAPAGKSPVDAGEPADPSRPQESAAVEEPPVSTEERRYIVQFTEAQPASLIEEAGGRPVQAADPEPGGASALPGRRAVTHMAAWLIPSAANRLKQDPRVKRVEPDARRAPLSQSVPWGVTAVRAPALWDASSPGAKVCVIDSGLHGGHEDLQLPVLDGVPGSWSEDSCGHGTHVAGTIAALDNGVGMVGVAPGTAVQVVKVFAAGSCDSMWASELVDALEQCRKSGARIVNMSLGGAEPTGLEREAFEAAWRDGMLLVAAAGNDGGSRLLYPASYPSVLSVGAVDESLQIAEFSQRNARVDLVAPGVNIASTVPFREQHALRIGDVVVEARRLAGSPETTGATGRLVDGGLCNRTGPWKGRVVLCRNSGKSLRTKVKNVAAGGGAAAVLYNSAPGELTGALGDGTSIPAIALAGADGVRLMDHVGSTATVSSGPVAPASGYRAWSGTSMAAAHVSGVAALLWGRHPEKTNLELRAALERSAEDLEAPGRDDPSGHGLLRAPEALALLERGPPGNLPPIPGFDVECRGRSCRLTSTSFDPDGELKSHVFEMEDGVVASGRTVDHVFPEPGRFPVRLRVTDAAGASADIVQPVAVCVP